MERRINRKLNILIGNKFKALRVSNNYTQEFVDEGTGLRCSTYEGGGTATVSLYRKRSTNHFSASLMLSKIGAVGKRLRRS